MSELTKEWLLKTIAELEEERDAVPGAVNEDALMALAAMKLALASLEAEAVAYVMADDLKDSSIISTPAYRDLGEAMERTVGDVVALFTAPPAPVAVPDGLLDAFDKYARQFTYNNHPAKPEMFPERYPFFEAGYRAAMLLCADPDFRENAETSTKCWCHTCRPVTISDMRFVVCPECGNKRCPHANDHRNACTGSNEPGQEGSAYPAAPQQEAKPL